MDSDLLKDPLSAEPGLVVSHGAVPSDEEAKRNFVDTDGSSFEAISSTALPMFSGLSGGETDGSPSDIPPLSEFAVGSNASPFVHVGPQVFNLSSGESEAAVVGAENESEADFGNTSAADPLGLQNGEGHGSLNPLLDGVFKGEPASVSLDPLGGSLVATTSDPLVAMTPVANPIFDPLTGHKVDKLSLVNGEIDENRAPSDKFMTENVASGDEAGKVLSWGSNLDPEGAHEAESWLSSGDVVDITDTQEMMPSAEQGVHENAVTEQRCTDPTQGVEGVECVCDSVPAGGPRNVPTADSLRGPNVTGSDARNADPGFLETGRAPEAFEMSHSFKKMGSEIETKVPLKENAICIAVFSAFMVVYNYSVLGTVLAMVITSLAMLVWRLKRATSPRDCCGITNLPYTCGHVSVDGRQLFLVATFHIAPRSPKDVTKVIESVSPDIVMIELDDERLNDMREDTECPSAEDLQPVKLAFQGEEPQWFHAQRTDWNGEYSGRLVSGRAFYDESDPYCLSENGTSLHGKVVMALPGGPQGELATWSLKAHVAAKRGASGLLVLNPMTHFPKFPRVGIDNFSQDVRTAVRFKRCGYPPIPLLLVPRDPCLRLVQQPREDAEINFEVLMDDYPRRSFQRKLCQNVGLLLSGMGVLYYVIECFNVDAGLEFLQAEVVAKQRGLPCVCIDVDDNALCSNVSKMLKPTPSNLYKSLRAWLMFPRVLMRELLFPAPEKIDLVGTTLLQVASFNGRTAIAMLMAATVASGVVGLVLMLVGWLGADVADGVVGNIDKTDLMTKISLAIQLYCMPRLYEAVAASRDESMYQAIVAKAKEHGSRRLVAVVGAAHANGILERARNRGLRGI